MLNRTWIESPADWDGVGLILLFPAPPQSGSGSLQILSSGEENAISMSVSQSFFHGKQQLQKGPQFGLSVVGVGVKPDREIQTNCVGKNKHMLSKHVFKVMSK